MTTREELLTNGLVSNELLAAWDARAENEEMLAISLGEQIGFGRMMQLGESLWRDKLEAMGIAGDQHVIHAVVGCCATFVVPCPHTEPRSEQNHPEWFDANGHCDWCCGSGRVTKRVAAAMKD